MKLPDSDKAKIANATRRVVDMFAASGNSHTVMVKISSGDTIAVRIFNATRVASIEGGIAKKRRSKKDV